mmetsp:Transcript_2370/g.5942  ORF Transcript_2370/g.5942 Transcript_2370/m.5942 type:complete len:229 (+) Transcript_2370:447-1133(+)
MGGVRAFEDSGQLRVADTRLLTGGADAAGADADLNDVCPAEDQLFRHLLGDDITRHDRQIRELLSHVADALHKGLGVAVCNVDTAHLHLGDCLQNLCQLVHVPCQDPRADSDIGERALPTARGPSLPLVNRVVLVDRRDALPLRQGLRHLKGADGVHVGRDDRHAGPSLLRVLEMEGPFDTNLRAARQTGPFGPEEDVLEVKLDLSLDHRHGFKEARRLRRGGARVPL